MKRNCYILFSDIKGFSKLSEDNFEVFSNEFIPYCYNQLCELIPSALAWNTWGDAIFLASDDPNFVVAFAFRYRELFRTFGFPDKIGKSLSPRIACHFGEVTLIEDLTLGKKNLFGINVNTAARLEPATRPGEIFVTRNFYESYSASPSTDKRYEFDPVGRIVCAKAFGELDAFRLRLSSESKQAIDWLGTLDLGEALPTPPSMKDEAEKILHGLRKLGPEIIKATLDAIASNSIYLGDTLLVIADMYKRAGYYHDALSTLEVLENYEMIVDGMKIYPYRYRQDAQKIKANSLTRVGKYEEAANIVYSLWVAGYRDSDTLAMLAAQYKRRAIYGSGQETKLKIEVNLIDRNLIDRAKKLYLEAFRRNLDDFYPAINAAYLFKMFGAENTGAGGTKLAIYIKEAWKSHAGENWWIDSTLAEAELLMDDYIFACDVMQRAIATHDPDVFELMSTKEQISIYAQIVQKEAEIYPLTKMLDDAIALCGQATY